MAPKLQMKPEEVRDLLVPTHIYYDPGTISLKVRAIGEIITKILFLIPENKAKFGEILDNVSKIIGVKNLPIQEIQAGLVFLQGSGIVQQQGKYWNLNKTEVERVKKDLEASESRINYILDKYFGTKLDRPILAKWFRVAAANFFGVYGDIGAKKLRRETIAYLREDSLSNAIESSIKDFKLEQYSKDLIDGFNSFVQDDSDITANQQVWSFSQAMLSAKLITASVGPDPLSVNEFRNAKLLLDTNVLLIASLEKSRLSKAFTELAVSLKDIGSSINIIYETKREYEDVITHKRNQIIKAINNYPLEIVSGAKDIFTKTAIARGCVNESDFNRFFDSIKDVPKSIGNVPVAMNDSTEIKKATDNGKKDSKKMSQIAAEWKLHHHWLKSQHSVIHDSALDSAADFMRGTGNKIWVITADNSMQTLAAKWAAKGLPTWIGIDALLQLLAISSVGPLHKPENFVPLLNTIIRDDLHSNDRIYTIEDLDALLDLEERVKELSMEEIEQFAAKMARLRMAGKPKGDSELQLEIRRTFQRKKMELDEKARILEGQVEANENSIKEKTKYGEVTKELLIKEIFAKRKLRNIGLYTLRLLLFLVIGITIIWYGASQWIIGHSNWGSLWVGIGLIEIILATVKDIVPRYKKAASKAMAWAKEEAEHKIKESEIKKQN